MKISSLIGAVSATIYIFSPVLPIYSQEQNVEVADELKELYRRPVTIEFPDDAPYNPQIATLGKMLFFDPRLSRAKNMSCATCHNPSFGWETPVDKAIGALNVPLERHAPTVLNLADAPYFMWDGQAQSLEEQAVGPITNPLEMNNTFPALVELISSIEGYNKWFEKLFPERGVSKQTILQTLATYERTIQSGISPFDRWLAGEEDAISEEAKIGFTLFNGKFGCAACHSGWNFTNYSFHDIGLDTDDIGRAKIESYDPDMMHAFKTTSLRNISTRAPYMHNGALSSLDSVVDHYISGGIDRLSKSPLITQLEVEDAEKQALIRFLETLTEDNQDVQAPTLPSQ